MMAKKKNSETVDMQAKKEAIEAAQTKLDEIIESNKKKAKENPEYQEMMKHFKKSLSDINKEACQSPWESSWALDYFVEFLRFMQAYYKLGVNVWAMERKDEDPKRYKNVPTRYESLTQAIAYYDKWQGLEDEYIQVELPENFKDLFDEPDETGCCRYRSENVKTTYKYGSVIKTYKKLHKEQEKYKKLFFMSLAEHMEEWWD